MEYRRHIQRDDQAGTRWERRDRRMRPPEGMSRDRPRPAIAASDRRRAIEWMADLARHRELDVLVMRSGQRHCRTAWPAGIEPALGDQVGVPDLLGDHAPGARHRRVGAPEDKNKIGYPSQFNLLYATGSVWLYL